MAARETAYAESLGESTTTSTTFQDKVSLAFTGSANTDYVVFYCSTNKASGSGANSEIKGLKGATDGPIQVFDPRDGTDFWAQHWMDFIENGGSPSEVTYKIQFRMIGLGTSHIKSARIYIIELGANDEFIEADGSSSESGSTFVDAISLTFTPPSVGDYYVIGSAVRFDNTAGPDHHVRLNHDTASVEHGDNEHNSDPAMDDFWNAGRRFASLAASSQTFSIEHRTEDGDDSVLREKRLLALRLDDFPASGYAESLSESTTTSTSYQDKNSLVFTPASSREHIIIGGHYWHTAANNQSFFGRWLDDTVEIQDEHLIEPRGTSANQGHMVGFFDQFTGDGNSHTYESEFHSESGTTARIRDDTILILQLDEAAGGLSIPVAAHNYRTRRVSCF